MIKYLQRRYALSRKGAIDNIKGILCCAMQNISFMLPVGLLYRLVSDMMSGTLTTGRIPFYVIGCVAAALFIVVCTRLEYDNTYLVTYVESGVRRVGLAEKLRKIPLSFFGKKDLADLTTSIMNDCAVLEQSHILPHCRHPPCSHLHLQKFRWIKHKHQNHPDQKLPICVSQNLPPGKFLLRTAASRPRFLLPV